MGEGDRIIENGSQPRFNWLHKVSLVVVAAVMAELALFHLLFAAQLAA